MEDYRLIISYEQYQKKIMAQIEEGQSILKSNVTSDDELKVFVNKVNIWKKSTSDKIYLLFVNTDNEIANMFKTSEVKIKYVKWDRIDEKEIHFNTSEVFAEAHDNLRSSIESLSLMLKYSEVSDIIKHSVTLEDRSNITTEEKKDILLSKLYQINTGEYHDFKLLLGINGILLRYKEEEHQLANNLRKSKWVDLKSEYSNNIKIRITVEGVVYIERKQKFKGNNNYKSKKQKGDYESICKKIDDLMDRLKKMELKNDVGQEILFTEIEELKELYLKLNKKNWKQMVLGKLADLSIGKAVENDTIKFIYERLTGDELKLLS